MAAGIVTPYVKVFASLFNGNDEGFLSAVDEVVALADHFWSRPLLREFLCTPALKSEWRETVLRRAFKDAGVGDAVERIFVLLLRKGRMGQLHNFSRELRAFADLRCGILRGTVESVVPLTAQETDRLKAILEKNTGKKTVLDSRTNPELLGGIKIRMNQMVLDASLEKALNDAKNKLNRMRA